MNLGSQNIGTFYLARAFCHTAVGNQCPPNRLRFRLEVRRPIRQQLHHQTLECRGLFRIWRRRPTQPGATNHRPSIGPHPIAHATHPVSQLEGQLELRVQNTSVRRNRKPLVSACRVRGTQSAFIEIHANQVLCGRQPSLSRLREKVVGLPNVPPDSKTTPIGYAQLHKRWRILLRRSQPIPFNSQRGVPACSQNTQFELGLGQFCNSHRGAVPSPCFLAPPVSLMENPQPIRRIRVLVLRNLNLERANPFLEGCGALQDLQRGIGRLPHVTRHWCIHRDHEELFAYPRQRKRSSLTQPIQSTSSCILLRKQPSAQFKHLSTGAFEVIKLTGLCKGCPL